MRYLSVCSGIEAASVAWHPLGWSPVAFAEIDAFPSRVLATRWPEVPNLGDFTAINLDDFDKIDVLVGGTPCQAFSCAGKRQSLADARGNLSLAYAVLAHELARSNGARWAVWENVPGVLSTTDNAFGCLLGKLVGGDDPVVPVARPAIGKSNAFWRWRKAGVELDDDGNEVVVEAGHITRWPSVGMVAGPLGRAAWRVLDAQYFGLAQRRRRVFVVVGFGDGADPAAILFEPFGLQRHPPTRGKTGEGSAIGSLAGTSPGGGWRVGADEAAAGQVVACSNGLGSYSGEKPTLRAAGGDCAGGSEALIAFGGGNCSGPIDIATASTAHGRRQDFDTETFVAHTLRAEGFDASEDGTGRGTPLGAPCVAFTCKDHGQDATNDLSPTLRAMQGAHANAGGQVAFAVPINQDALRGEGTAKTSSRDAEGRMRLRDPGFGVGRDGDLAGTVTASGPGAIATSWAVRRLTPTECERLQGFPDGYTAIPGAADGPRYKALGNSMATNVMAWIGRRIELVDGLASLYPAPPHSTNREASAP